MLAVRAIAIAMALLATKEEHIEEKVLATAKAAGTDITALGEQVAIKGAFTLKSLALKSQIGDAD